MSAAKYRIAIVGCGPGGLAAALMLRRAGHNVTLFEQFTEAQPVGSGLLIQPAGQAVLATCGLLDNLKALAARVGRLHGISVTSGRRALDVNYEHAGEGAPALGVHRASLFAVLMDAVRAAEIPVLVNHKLVAAKETSDAITPVFAAQGAGTSFDLLVDASGARSPLVSGKSVELPFGALWATVDIPENGDVPPAALNQRYLRARQMAGIMPIGHNPETGNAGAAIFWSVRRADAAHGMAGDAGPIREAFCALWPEAAPYVSQVQSIDDWTLATYHHRTGNPAASPRRISIGDSWHCTSPQLGQGANMALIDAAALARALDEATDLVEVGRRYRQLRQFHVSLYQTLSWLFTPLYQSGDRVRPLLRDLSTHYLGGMPLARNLIALTVSGGLGATKLG